MVAQLPEAAPNHAYVLLAFEFAGRSRALPMLHRSVAYRPVRWIPARVYYRLMRYGIEPPIGVSADLAFFPNFCAWRVTGVRLVPVIHDLAFARHPEFVERSNLDFLRRAVPRTLARAWRVVVPSDHVRADLAGVFGYPPEKIIVAPSPLGLPFRQEPGASAVGPPTSASGDQAYGSLPYILFVGTLEPRKNVEGLLDAFGSLEAARRGEVRLLLAGGWGWRTEAIKSALRRSQDAGVAVELREGVDDRSLVRLYRGALLTVLPSHDEGFGLPILEAMACGCPVVASDAGGIAEAANGAAILVRAGDSRALADALDSLISDAALRSRLSGQGLERVRRYEQTGFATPFARLIDEAAAEGAGKRL